MLVCEHNTAHDQVLTMLHSGMHFGLDECCTLPLCNAGADSHTHRDASSQTVVIVPCDVRFGWACPVEASPATTHDKQLFPGYDKPATNAVGPSTSVSYAMHWVGCSTDISFHLAPLAAMVVGDRWRERCQWSSQPSTWCSSMWLVVILQGCWVCLTALPELYLCSIVTM